jgi:hypothetical protein
MAWTSARSKVSSTPKTHLSRRFVQKDRPSLVPQKAVSDVRDSQSR